MRIESQTFWLSKAGNSEEEYEDAAWPKTELSGSFSTYRTAVADGATETSFSAIWAKLLVQAYEKGIFEKAPIPDGLPPLQRLWRDMVGSKPLPWYAEQKLESGAFASLVGLTLVAEGATWLSTAVGDSCLFHIRGDQLLVAFPLERSEQFDSRPMLVSSNSSSNANLAPHVLSTSGEWLPGDRFLLMSDAIACWFLRRWEAASDPLGFLDDIDTQEMFAEFVASQRGDVHENVPMLKNDDTTVVLMKVFEA